MMNTKKTPIPDISDIPDFTDTLNAIADLYIEVDELMRSRTIERAKRSPTSVTDTFFLSRDELPRLKRSESPDSSAPQPKRSPHPLSKGVVMKQGLFSPLTTPEKPRGSPAKPPSSGAYACMGPGKCTTKQPQSAS